jgi:hypothetical protein
MGVNNTKNEVICDSCKISQPYHNFYKYQLKEENPKCKNCVKRNRKPKKTENKKISLRGLYVISTIEKAESDFYKVGKHSGTQRALISRYKTYLINPIIYFYIPHDTVDEFETEILSELSEYRIHDNDGGDTEWVKLPLEKLLTIIIDKL